MGPTGPFPIGNTTVTLTCGDQAGAESVPCTATVTVVDQVMPEVTLNGPASEGLECSRTPPYRDPGASANDAARR